MATPLNRIGTEAPDVNDAAAVTLDFDRFFEDEYPRLFAALCLTTRDRDEAEELTQEAFVRVFERWDRVSVMTEPGGYLHAAAMNLFRKRYRRARVAERLRSLRASPPKTRSPRSTTVTCWFVRCATCPPSNEPRSC